MENLPTIKWNNKVKLIFSDVDETVADLFTPATPEMILELDDLLKEGKSIFLVTGCSFTRVKERIIDQISPELRKRVLVSHCSGAEVIGFDESGEQKEPYYSLYDKTLNQKQKDKWREIFQQIVKEFKLELHPSIPVKEFKEKYGDNPLAVMFEDRGPQITLEFVNGFNLTTEHIDKLKHQIPNFDVSDLRIPVMKRASELLEEANIPVTPRLGGTFALDLALKGVSKTTSIKYVIENKDILSYMGLVAEDVNNPDFVEIWGDKYSVINGGTDRHMSEALPKDVRSIDFREENPQEFLPGYNIVIWNGKYHLHEGLLEYLQSRA